MTDKKSPAETEIESALRTALIFDDRMTLPPMDASDGCATNAEKQAVYAAWYRDVHTFLLSSVLAHFLIRIGETSPRLANEMAHEVRSWLDAGDAYPEWIWQWATERGMDPEAIRSEAKAEYEAWLVAEPKRYGTRIPAQPTEKEADRG